MIDFAVNIIKLTTKFSNSPAGKQVSKQILRSGTSPAPNYAEARSAENPNDFIHKSKIALKELNETKVWLQIIVRNQMILDEFSGVQMSVTNFAELLVQASRLL